MINSLKRGKTPTTKSRLDVNFASDWLRVARVSVNFASDWLRVAHVSVNFTSDWVAVARVSVLFTEQSKAIPDYFRQCIENHLDSIVCKSSSHRN